MNPRPVDSHLAAQAFFDKIALDYTARSQTAVYNVSSLSFSRRQDIVSRLMGMTPRGGVLLDYGMGPAVFGPVAVQQGLRYVGIDISAKMVELALSMNLPYAEFHVGDLTSLDKQVQVADTVLAIGLIDYLEEPAAGLRKLARCVKPGGRLIMSFRNHRSVPRLLRNTAKDIWRRFHRADRQGATAFVSPVLENSFVPGRDFTPLLRSEGFGEVKVVYLDCSPVFFNFPLPRTIWTLWKKSDEMLAGRALSLFCASGVLLAVKQA